MAEQNIYDNETFFEGYHRLRERDDNANVLFEMPALFSLLPELKGKNVLDLGCGFGEHCMHMAQTGACKVVGIDISEKMLQVARAENAAPNIVYYQMPMEDISRIEEYFDLVVSSLAFHYVEDFEGLIRDCLELLKPGGILVFSQEHPFSTCYGELSEGKETESEGLWDKLPITLHCPENRWTRDADGKKWYLNLAGYGLEGERESKWFVEGVKKYHRTFSTILNTLTAAGFVVEKTIEPLPTTELLAAHPEQADLFHKPDFLVIRARKKGTEA